MNATRWRLSRPVGIVLAACLVSGSAFAVATGISSASTMPRATAPAATPAGGWQGGRAGIWPGSAWGRPGAWRAWAPASPGRTEYFHVASTKQAGPGAIIVTGVINDGGIEHPGRATDSAVFSNGTFRIDHRAGHPTARFDPRTCVGTITQSGPFHVYDGTGRFAALSGSGTYWFYATYTVGRDAAGCTKTVTAYIETINGAIKVST